MWIIEKAGVPPGGWSQSSASSSSGSHGESASTSYSYSSTGLQQGYQPQTESVSFSSSSQYSYSASTSGSRSARGDAAGTSWSDFYSSTLTGEGGSQYSSGDSETLISAPPGSEQTVGVVSTTFFTENTFSSSTLVSSTGSSGPPATGAPYMLATTASGTGGSEQETSTVTATTVVTIPTLTGSGSDRATAVSTSSATTLTTSADSSHLLNDVYGTTASAAYSAGATVGPDHYVFATDERAYLLRLSASFAGLRALTECGVALGSSYRPDDSTSATFFIGLTPTGTFQAVANTLSSQSSAGTAAGTTFSSDTTSAPALSVPLAAVPNGTSASAYTPQGTTSVTFSQDVDLGQVSALTAAGSGNARTSVATLTYPATVTVPTFVSDDRGRITGTTQWTLTLTGSTTALDVGAATSGGDESQTAAGSGSTSASGATTASGSTGTSSPDVVYSASSFLGQATILEATFDPAVRFGSSGKYSSVTGPGASEFYPWWSQVWHGLWMPITYTGTRTGTYQNTATSGDSVYSYTTATGPTISASFAWSSGSVSLTTRTGSSDSTASGSVSFVMAAAASDAGSYSTSRGADTDGVYVAGGTQWADQSAQLWLGSGIWQCTSYDSSGGSTTGRSTVTAPVSTSALDSSLVVAARPVPAWACVVAYLPGDPCLAVFTIDPNA